MPVSPRRNASASGTGSTSPPAGLRPYLFHGMDLAIRGGHGVGDCPFCGSDGKFSADCDSGLWRCFVCGAGTDRGGGNALVFIRLLYHRLKMDTPPEFFATVAQDRRLREDGTVGSWGICRGPGDEWIVPGYGSDGEVSQLYRRVRMFERGKYVWRLLPTPGVWPDGKAHALHMSTIDFNQALPAVHVCEGPWDGMALWEVMRSCGQADANVIAVPGCNVWRDEWTAICRDKHVTLWFDSDHPRIEGGRTFRAGFDGMYRVTKRLSGVAASVRWLRWGKEGWDESKPSGWDVRDAISGTGGPPLLMVDRRSALLELFSKVEDAPADWFLPTASFNGRAGHAVSAEARHCDNWMDCEAAWKLALKWRQDMSDALAVLLAVCASTQQGGNQLFLQLIGSAGSGKTTICDGLLVSHHCHHLEHLTGFHSGWRKPRAKGKGKNKDKEDEGGNKDCSLIARINGKTLVTPEADVLMSSPRFDEIMGQQRRIFDGKSGATYKNSDEDTLYVALRTPWIMAGTPTMMDHDQSHLGDRFLRLIISDPSEDEKRDILRSALRSERVAMLESANGTAGSIVDPKTRTAHALTGGYVDWLRAHVEEKLTSVEISAENEERCLDLAELSADLRARPNEDKRKKDTHDTKELPTRLARQNIRLATCLAVVFNKRVVDSDVMRIVRKVALDTAFGHSLNIVQWLCGNNPRISGVNYQDSGGLGPEMLTAWLHMPPDRAVNYLLFLRRIGVLVLKRTSSGDLWLLTERVYNLYQQIMRAT